ncbi:MAG: histidine triad nucleotide-binding protein [Bermanella sp.]|jgi:Diadenosine tetraphosphate (Ap4A) hydrolase and other HIT family hydrolases
MSDCIFCKIVDGDIPSKKVYEDDSVLAFYDAHPKADTHILVIPKQHIVNLYDVQAHQWPLVQQVLQSVQRIAEQENLVGYRLISNNGAQGGQEVFHMHWHILAGDKLPGFQ